MRADMWKVIVERPRLGRSTADAVGRRARKLAPGDEDGALLGRIEPEERARRTKHLNENLAPLRRYLQAQVGRPWDKVYSEMRAHISFDNVVQKHVLAHLDAFLWRDVILDDDGAVRSRDPWQRVAKSGTLYVHPRTGLIRRVPLCRRPRASDACPRSDVVKLSQRACLKRICGAWFEVTLAPVPRWPAVKPLDVVTGRPAVDAWHRFPSAHPYGVLGTYAVAKRQLGKRELRAHRAAGLLPRA